MKKIIGNSTLSGYRIMWLQVIFDLPVGTFKQRKDATLFRNFLLDNGFEMLQYSVYIRVCSDKDMANKYKDRIRLGIPQYGKVSILMFTDKQFENMEHFFHEKKKDSNLSTYQLELF